MAKSKNHTANNQTYKAHRNGIKRPKRHRKRGSKGVTILFSFQNKYFFVRLIFFLESVFIGNKVQHKPKLH